jgi:hypothetical protein
MVYQVIVMACFNRYAGLMPVPHLLMTCLVLALFVLPVSAADAEIDTYLGDTVTISGVSYVSDRVYLFLTGPGLPDNGVTLTDTSQKAEDGKFTIVDAGSDQSWSFRWDTSRISQAIDPGVYLVYVTTEPVDKAHLGGTDTYKTLDVWLKDPHTSGVSVSAGASYTLNPEKHSSSSSDVPTFVFTSAPTTPAPVPTNAVTTVATAVPTTAPTKAPSLPAIPLLAVLVCGALCIMRHRNQKEA